MTLADTLTPEEAERLASVATAAAIEAGTDGTRRADFIAIAKALRAGAAQQPTLPDADPMVVRIVKRMATWHRNLPNSSTVFDWYTQDVTALYDRIAALEARPRVPESLAPDQERSNETRD